MSIYRCKVPVGIEVFEVSNDQNQASINALPICLPSHPDPSKVQETAWSDDANIEIIRDFDKLIKQKIPVGGIK